MTSPSDHRFSSGTADVAVLGLGSMGAALAQTFIDGGRSVVVWNRTAARAVPLHESGAMVAASPEDAALSAPLLVTCVRDHQATRDLLGGIPVESLRGRTVVVLASSTPGEARSTQEWARDAGIEVLIGAIMVPTPLVGTSEALVIYSGRADLFDEHRPVLETIAPRSVFVGDDPGRAALLDVAMLDIFFAGMTSFLHAAAIVTANGLTAEELLPWADSMVSILPDTFRGLARDVDARSFAGDEDNLAMELASLDHIREASREAAVDDRLPGLMHDLAADAVGRGHGADAWSRVVDLLRQSP